MAGIPGGVPFTGFVAPTDSTDTYPVTKPDYGQGGAREVADLPARDAIPSPRRSLGMLVYVQDSGATYRLEGVTDNTGWVPVSAAGDLSYTHSQLVPSSLWTVNHNLGKKPSVSVTDSGGTEVVGDVTYLDNNRLTVSFSAPFGGTAFLN